MKKQIEGQLTLFQVDSHVSHFHRPGNGTARKTTVISGQKCSVLYRNCSPVGSLVKMCLGSSIWHSTRCYLTWKAQGTKSKRLLFRLVASMPHTNETESVLWPTPSTGAALCGGTGNFKTLKRMQEIGMITEEERRQLSQGNGGKTNPEFLEWLMGYETQFTKLVPTPVMSDYKGATVKRAWKTRSQIVHVERERERERKQTISYDSTLRSLVEVTPYGKIGNLNPDWEEWLMGYPIGWSALSV